MKIHKLILFFATVLCMQQQSFGQEKLKAFYTLMQQNDTLAARNHLEKWHREHSEDPELYLAYLNYYYFKSKEVEMKVVDNPENYSTAVITNADSVEKGEDAVYAIPKEIFNQSIMEKGFEYIDAGISKHPNRLDMRFEKVYVLNQIGDYESLKEEIIGIVMYSQKNNNNWMLAHNTQLESAKESMLYTIQDFVIQLIRSRDTTKYDKVRQISETILKFYPDHIQSLTNLSNIYATKKEYDKSIAMLKKAYDLNPNDMVIIGNMALTYEESGDIENALKYFQLMKKNGTEDAKNFAKSKIKKLKKQ